MKRLGLMVLSTIILTGCTSTNGILTIKDIEEIDHKQVEEIVNKQKNILYTPEEVNEVITKINNLGAETIDKNEYTHEIVARNYSSKEEKEYFNKVVDILDETIAKGLRNYIDSHAEIDIGKEGVQTAIIGRVSVYIDNDNINRMYYDENENIGNNISIKIYTKDIKDKEYLNLINSIKAKDFLLQDIKLGKYQNLIKISNVIYLHDQKDVLKKTPPQVSYEIFTKDKEIEKVRVSIIKEKSIDVEGKDITPLKNIGSILRFNTKDFKVLEDITSNINQNVKGNKKISTDGLEYKYRNIEKVDRYTESKQHMIEVTIEKNNK
ncbi:hypothetical protein Curi_c18700 [Gottschalkia acidurici 9a]|uniref:Lipoprotein n=1 Tax=Gottschalkia acidurici (strain ATCC 7906 / DSM 604 / BCRC 14475 / CIP 104303 / KCTC 5404 / NCIMB 10678 / 9a) TaxID=1128398 RepID=K0B2P9_GOTA9|nr:hypothetical protein [Gottschalkia acidurici]AFS78876.1 hypothetical protein Curi_c18700 [Gottschalkia acidurici 9a]